MRGLAVERGLLLRIFAVAQVAHLLDDDGEAVGKAHAGDVVEVRGDLRVIGGDVGQRVGGESLPKLRRQRSHLTQLADELLVMSREETAATDA